MTMTSSSCILLVIFGAKLINCFNDFPSLMIANATMAIVIDKTFYERKVLAKETTITNKNAYEKSVINFASALTKITREKMNKSGLSIHVFQDIGVNLARDYTILLSVSTCQTTWDLFRRAKKEKIVHLAITDLKCPRLPANRGISIPLVDPGEELPQIFYDLRMSKGLDWNRANILHDDTFGQDVVGEIVQAFYNDLPGSSIGLASNSLFSMERGSSDIITKQRIKRTLSNFSLGRSVDDRFIVLAAHDTIPFVLEVARSLKLMSTESQWLFVVPNMNNFSQGNITYLIDLLGEGENLAFLYNDTNSKILSNSSCQFGALCHAKELVGALGNALEKVLEIEVDLYNRVTEEEFESTGLTKLVRSRHIIKHLRDNLYNETRSEELRGNTCGRCLKWTIVSALTWGYRNNSNSRTEKFEFLVTGEWTPDPGYVFRDNIFPHVVHGFRGKALPIAIYHNPPWQFQTTDFQSDEKLGDYRNDKWEGLMIDVIDELARKLNFTIKLVVVELPSEMSRVKSDPLRASMSAAEKIPKKIIELISSKSVFMAACASTVGNYRKDPMIDFTMPISMQTYGILTAKPEPASRVLLFATPYSTEAWACLVTSIIVVGTTLYAVNKYSPRRVDESKGFPDGEGHEGFESPLTCVWYIYGALLQQGIMPVTKTDGSRLIVGTWWIVVMVLVATYSGSLVAFLTFPRMQPGVETVDDLLERRAEFTWSIPADSFLENYLVLSNEEGADNYKGLLPGHDPNAEKHDTINYEANVMKVKEKKHIVIDWLSSLRISSRNDYQTSGYCHFSLGTDVLLLEEPIAMLVPPKSPYLKIINIRLQQMHESGFINKWITDRMPTRDQCWEGPGGGNFVADNHKVDLDDMQGIFFVLLFGYLIGTIFLSGEFIKHFRKLAKEKNLITPYVE